MATVLKEVVQPSAPAVSSNTRPNLRKQHHCEGVLRCCIDFRFWPTILKYVEEHHLTRGDYDLDPNAGGVKDIIDQAVREQGIKGILISCRLHTMRKVVLVAHEDCGAYGGSASFANSQEERAFHIAQLCNARDIIEDELRTRGEGCYGGKNVNQKKEYVFLYAGISEDGTRVVIEDVTNTQ